MRRSELLVAAAACGALVTLGLACSDSSQGVAGFEDTPDAANDVSSVPSETSEPPSDVSDAGDAGADVSTPENYDPSDEPVVCGSGPCAQRLAAGDRHVCALMADGTIRCWGDNTKGAVGLAATDAGDGSGPPVSADLVTGIVPRVVAAITSATQISAGDDVTCTRLADGTVQCWGANNTGQLGLSSVTPKSDALAHPAPSTVDITAPAVRVDVGHGSVCAKLATGELSCWGTNAQKQLLTGSAAAVGGPAVAAVGALDLLRTTSSNTTIYGVTANGQLFSWGMVSGRDTSFVLDGAPRENVSLSDVVDVAVGPSLVDNTGMATFHACAIAKARVYCWGSTLKTELPALCTGVPNDRKVPTLAPVQRSPSGGFAFPQQIAAGRLSTCVRLTDGTVQCCGDDTRGQMGTGSLADPPAVLSLTPAKALQGYAVQVVTTRYSTCALLRDGSVACWGGNRYGELGQGTVDVAPHATPVKVAF